MESLSKSYVNAHGLNLKIAFAESLVLLLHPIGKVTLTLFTGYGESETPHRVHKQKQITQNGPKRLKSSTLRLGR